MFTSVNVAENRLGNQYALGVQLRYNYRLYPAPAQRVALARAFGCAQVVFNDGLPGAEEAEAQAA